MHQNSKLLQHSDGVNIHRVDTIIDPEFPTILYLPGLSSEAIEGIKHLTPLLGENINVASMSFRGRGRSSTPEKGYGIEDHAKDLDLVVRDLNAKKLVLIATSVSALYAIKYLETYGPQAVDRFVIVDHPLKVRKLRDGWADDFSKITVGGVPVTSTMRRSALDAVEQESAEVNLYPQLRNAAIPTLVMYPTVPKGIISDSDVSAYGSMPHVRMVEFEDSDHFIRLRQPEKYLQEVGKFARSFS